MTKLKIRIAPDSVLRQKSQSIKVTEVKSVKIQKLIRDIKDTLKNGEYGIGMSSIQVGIPLAITVVMIRPTPTRPKLKQFNKVYFNAEIIRTEGEKVPMWEGCCSVLGKEDKPIYAQVPRYEKIRVRYLDEDGAIQEETVDGFLAHVLQHEIDHQNGILFTDLINEFDIVSYDDYKRISNSE
jgi:peptide deformylase